VVDLRERVVEKKALEVVFVEVWEEVEIKVS
jgi:hypothetical protein